MGINLLTHRAGVVVTPDALALLATSLALWQAVLYRQTGKTHYILLSALAAALAASSKYNYATAFTFPLMAHLLRIVDGRERMGTGIQVGTVGVFLFGLFVFLFPAVLDPVRFLHNVSSALNYYVAPDPPPLWKMVYGYGAKVVALFQGGDFVVGSGEAIQAQQKTRFQPWLPSLPLLVLLSVGLWHGLRRIPRNALIVIIPAVAASLSVGPNFEFYFARYMLPGVSAWAVVLGIGISVCGAWVRRRFGGNFPLGGGLVLLAVLLAFLPYAISQAQPREADSRVLLSQWALKNLPKGSRLWIARETRWYISPEEKKHFAIQMGTIAQAMQNPPRNVDYLILPRKVQLYQPLMRRPDLVAAYNAWLSPLKAVHEEGLKTKEAVYFGKPTISPHVLIVRPSELPSGRSVGGRDMIYGVALQHSIEDSNDVHLSDGPLAVTSRVTLNGSVVLTTPTATLRLTARGTSPFRQQEQPTVSVDIRNADANTTSLLANFTLGRSQAGLLPYNASLNNPLPPGNYVVRVRVTDPDGLPVAIEMLEFLPTVGKGI
jgi:hypothetical protein